MSDQTVVESTRVDWQYDEIALVCDVVVANGWKALDRRTDARVEELSQLLRRAAPEMAKANPKFRNPDGVGRKSYDIETCHPSYGRKQTKGGRTTAEVVQDFIDDPQGMHEYATAVRAAIEDPTPLPSPVDVDMDATFEEGRAFERRHLARERDPHARRKKIEHARKTLGHVRCEACGFDFEATYGPRGRDFIECHHRKPLSVTGPSKTALADLALLCSNCHRMIHRTRPWLTVEQLTTLVRENGRNGQPQR